MGFMDNSKRAAVLSCFQCLYYSLLFLYILMISQTIRTPQEALRNTKGQRKQPQTTVLQNSTSEVFETLSNPLLSHSD